MKINQFITSLVVALAATSCASRNQLTYFVDRAEVVDAEILVPDRDFSLRIVPDDQLSINVTSLQPEASAMFNLPATNLSTRGSLQATSQAMLQSYIVNEDGDINFPILGKIHVAGLTTKELTDLLVKRISEHVKDPTVRVEIVNFAINVLGEVNRPGRLEVNREAYTLLDALAEAGDLSQYAKRDNILLIRRDGDKLIYHRFSLEDSKSLESPYFFLKQNDVIYVEPGNVVADNAKYNSNNSFKISVVSTVVSCVSVIASLVIALTR